MTDYVWDPVLPREVAAVFSPLGIDWWIAGGVAIDLFAGRTTREHGDIDVAILRRDVAYLRPLVDSWEIRIAHDGALTPWRGEQLTPQQHQFWVRRPGVEPWSFEILLEATDGANWIYRRDDRIRRSVDTIGRRTRDGLPYLAPEICLLYKSPLPLTIDRNNADFETASPLLDEAARAWLRTALTTLSPEHPWLERL